MIMNTITITLPTIEQIEFQLIAEYESIPVRGNALTSGDDDYDRKEENRIIAAIGRGNVWAWASVELKGTYKGLTASNYLGCCSYKNEKDFMKDGYYYQDMKQNVFDEIIEQLKALSA